MPQEKEIGNMELASKVTMKLLISYFEKTQSKDPEFLCPVCQHQSFTIPISSSNEGLPLTVTFPIPNFDGKGIWNYMIICDKCSHTMFFNTWKVVQALKDSGEI
ncbi:hypothetical protein [Yersinia sp. 22-579]|uniref:hypothetical protein n=1 Tax=Yersinia sp. 22-579 TaxID=3057580 RepID=UPI00263AAD66|nr:hypothetical protein [Yersinia sp. 22-579]